MKTVWIATACVFAASAASAQPTATGSSVTIYKHVDDSGRITYTNKPMKGAVAMELDPITVFPGLPASAVTRAAVMAPATGTTAQPVLPAEKSAPEAARLEITQKSSSPQIRIEPLPDSRTATATSASPAPATPRPTLASIEPMVQRKRDEERRRILEGEMKQEESSLVRARELVMKEQQNPQLVAAVRAAQSVAEPTPTQMAEFRSNLEKASGRIRGLQATVAEHEKNIEALRKELGALKP
jgi:hypothetical protein